MVQLDYPAWLRIEHWVNVLFVTLLIRSGIEILGTHPKLYWRNDSKPGTEWARFTRKTMPTDKLYDTLDEEESYSSIVALPGHKKLGMGRHWHFITVMGWILLGIAYYALLFATGQWHRYIPYSWSIFPEAWNDILTYLSFKLPSPLPGEPLDAIQKLTYASVIFILAPFLILTGAAQSPAVEARFPWYVRLWGGRQGARSLHFFGLVAFIGFIAVHLMMVGLWGWPQLTALMIFGHVRHLGWALAACMAIIAAIVLVHVAATVWSLRSPRTVQRALGFLTMQDTGRDEPSADGAGQFYEIIDLSLAYYPQCLLAYEMNGRPLPIKHGAPLRLRIENQVGFKMAKWIERIEFISGYQGIGEGMGGWREDNAYYDKDVAI